MYRRTKLLSLFLAYWLLFSTPSVGLAVQTPADPILARLPPKVVQKFQQALYASGFRTDYLPASVKITLPQQGHELYSIQVGVYLFDINPDGNVSMQGNALEQAAEMQADTEEITEPNQQHAAMLRETLAALDESRMIVFAPKGEVKHVITIFTDVSCPYSVELHREIDLLMDAGVKVRYLGYPRMGEDSLGYQKMRPVWCSDNPKQAFNRAINNQRLHLARCDISALESHVLLGNSLGLMGTPTLLFEDGSVSTGYSSAIDILSYLENGTELPPASFSWVADFADTPDDTATATTTEVEAEPAQEIALENISTPVETALRNNLRELWLNPMAWQQAKFTATTNFYSTTIGAYRFDISKDGSFVMKMNVLENRPQFTEQQRAELRKQALLALDESSAIIFAPEHQAVQHTVTIFVDANCHFCLSQYRETPYLTQQGVKVRYLAYPSEGLDSLEYALLNTAWCAPNRQKALLAMKLKEPAPQKLATCQNPVAAHYELARSLGIQGTPTTVLENGQLLPGYVSSDEILEHLENKEK